MRRTATVTAIAFALLMAGCTPARLVHSESFAAVSAEDFVRILIVDKDNAAAYALLDESARARVSESKLGETTEKTPGYADVTDVTVTDTRAAPGKPEVQVFLKGTAGSRTIYYLVVMAGTSDSGYRPKHFAAGTEPFPPDGAAPVASQARAREVADEVASAVVARDEAALYGLMESAFRASTTLGEAKGTISRIISYGGQPVRATFKDEESGTQASTAGARPLLTYWYLLETSGGSAGPYYLKVDVVSDDGVAAVAQFSVVNFPVNGPPENLK